MRGTTNLFVMVEPLAGWRHVAVTERRTKVDFAEAVRWLAEERYPDVEYVRIVLDNLNTHGLPPSVRPSRRSGRGPSRRG